MKQDHPLDHVAVVGAGTMGSGIATACLRAGLTVTLIDVNAASLERGRQGIGKIVHGDVAKGRCTTEAAEVMLGTLAASGELAAAKDADIVIEAVIEDLAVKQAVFAELDRIARPGAILATNTSTLDVNAIARATARPADVLGLHFFSPAHVMRLLEIVQGADTSDATLRSATELARRIGKIGVVVGVCHGFVGNRMLEPYAREAHRLLLEGASPSQVDGVLTGFGMAMGVLSMCDMAGNDVGALIRKGNAAAFAGDPSYCRMGDVLVARGELGQKTGLGFHAYAGREKAARADIDQLIADEAASLGIDRRRVADAEIFERCLYVLVNEGFRILDEGIARAPADIDTIWCNGYGFPAQLGGPMRWAQSHGLTRIHDRLEHWRAALGDYGERWFVPAPALVRLVRDKRHPEDLFPARTESRS